MSTTIGDLGSRAIATLDALVETADPVVDEWQYVTDLRAVWGARLVAVVTPRASEPADDEQVAAVEALDAVARSIGDPHRAIDWLSTLPQAILLAIGEPPS